MFRWLALCLLLSFITYGQEEVPNVSTYGRLHGIPPMKITDMASDSSGNLWLISNLGLHKFNGHEIQSFSELKNSFVTDVQVRSDGTVFAALLDEGIAIYDVLKDSFAIYADLELFKVNEGGAFNIVFGPNLEIYTAHNGLGVARFYMDQGRFELILEHKFINSFVVEASTGHLILGADDILRYDPENAELDVILNVKTAALMNRDDGILFYSYYHTNEVGWLDLEKSKGLARVDVGDYYAEIISFTEDAMWVASDAKLIEVNIAEKTAITRLLSKTYITGLHVDKKGRIWMGYDNQLHTLDPLNQPFSYIDAAEQFFYHRMLSLDEERMFSIPFNEREFHILNTTTDQIQMVAFPSSIGNLETAFDLARMGDSVWISFVNGLAVYDILEEKVMPIMLKNGNEFFSKSSKQLIVAHDEDYLYIATNGAGEVFRINSHSLEVDSMQVSPYLYLESVHAHPSGISALGETGLIDIDFNTHMWKEYPYSMGGDEYFMSFSEGCATVHDTMWILTGGEILKGVLESDSLELTILDLGNAREGFNDYLDITTTSEGEFLILSSSDLILYSPISGALRSYSVDEGIATINRKSRTIVRDEEVFIIGDGIYSSSLDAMRAISQKAPITYISSLELNGLATCETVFKASENDVKVNFESVDLSRPLDIKYKYRLDNLKPWQYVAHNEKVAYFPALKPGSYEFQVSAKHKFSPWGPIAEYTFLVNQPFWLRPWFILTVLTLLGLGAYFLARFRINEVRKFATIKSRMAELENEALRAQMNPHFIFNSLNSVKAFIIDHDREAAADYLTNFSELIRLILANSREKYIPLSKELYTLKLYMDIENIRLEDKFSYTVENHAGDFLIQPLTLQPFIENAIWHGIVHKEAKGHIHISVLEEGGNVEVTIQDDGVGRMKSHQVSGNSGRKRSYGILITRERLANSSAEDKIKIIDLYDESGKATGTKVILTIKKNHG